MSTLKDRLTEIMDAKGLKTGEIARAAGVSSSAVSQWLGKGGKDGKIIQTIKDIEAAYRLEVVTGYRAVWIAVGKGPKMVDASKEPQPQVAEPMDQFAHAILHAFNELPDNPVVRGQAFLGITAEIERGKTAAQRQRTPVHAGDHGADSSS